MTTTIESHGLTLAIPEHPRFAKRSVTWMSKIVPHFLIYAFGNEPQNRLLWIPVSEIIDGKHGAIPRQDCICNARCAWIDKEEKADKTSGVTWAEWKTAQAGVSQWAALSRLIEAEKERKT